MEFVRLINERPAILKLPPLTVNGERIHKDLLPGGNKVSLEIIEALEALDKSKGPGKIWKQWQDLGWISVDSDPNALDKPDGPEPLRSLDDYNEQACAMFAARETDIEALQRWHRLDKRKEVKQILERRLKELGEFPNS